MNFRICILVLALCVTGFAGFELQEINAENLAVTVNGLMDSKGDTKPWDKDLVNEALDDKKISHLEAASIVCGGKLSCIFTGFAIVPAMPSLATFSPSLLVAAMQQDDISNEED